MTSIVKPVIRKLTTFLQNTSLRKRHTCSASVKENNALKILFFGTDSFSLATLEALHTAKKVGTTVSGLEACCAKMKTLVPVVREFSSNNGITVHPWPPDPDICKTFDIGIVSSFGHLIPSKIINSFPMGVLNVHASLLPRWRGAAPIAHAIINGDTKTGISIMEVKAHHFDVGNVLATEECAIGPDVTRSELSEQMSKIGAKLMVKVINDLHSFRESSQPQQPTTEITYAPKIGKESFEIHWTKQTALQVYNQYRAVSDLSKLHSTWQETNKVVRLNDIVHPAVIENMDLDRLHPDAQPGELGNDGLHHHLEKRALCSTFLECAAMGMSVINPRYITDLQGLNDRTVKFKQEYMQDLPDLELEQIRRDVVNYQEEADLEDEINNLELKEIQLKISRIERLQEELLLEE